GQVPVAVAPPQQDHVDHTVVVLPLQGTLHEGLHGRAQVLLDVVVVAVLDDDLAGGEAQPSGGRDQRACVRVDLVHVPLTVHGGDYTTRGWAGCKDDARNHRRSVPTDRTPG